MKGWRVQGHSLLLPPMALRICQALIAILLLAILALQIRMAGTPQPLNVSALPPLSADRGQELIVGGLHVDKLLLTHDQRSNELAYAYFPNGRLDAATLQSLAWLKPPADAGYIAWLPQNEKVTPEHPVPVNTTISIKPLDLAGRLPPSGVELHFFQKKGSTEFGDAPYFEMEAIGMALQVTLEVNAPVGDDDEPPGLFRTLILGEVLNQDKPIDGRLFPITVIVPENTPIRFCFRPAQPNTTLWDKDHLFTPFQLAEMGAQSEDMLRADLIGVKPLEDSHSASQKYLKSVLAIARPTTRNALLSVTGFKVGADQFQARVTGWGLPRPDKRTIPERIAAAFKTSGRAWMASLAVEAVLLLCLFVLQPIPVFEPPADGFDVFLCHNSVDKPAVRKIAKQLEQAGIRTWLDEEELRPGHSYQSALEEQIRKCKSVAIFIGKHGMGPWQHLEQEAFIRQFIKRQCPTIPVILPDCKGNPEMPLFLEGMMWVDFRKHVHDPLDELIFGITGKKRDASPDRAS